MNKNLLLFILSFLLLSIVESLPPPNCQTGLPSDPTNKCLICNPGYFLIDATTTALCVPLIPNCGAQITAVQCAACVQGYVLSGSQKSCQLPILNCDDKSTATQGTGFDDQGKCFRCLTGFSVSRSGLSCVKTIVGCSFYDDLGNCIQVKNCLTYHPTDSTCAQCIQGFVLSMSKQSCLKPVANCAISPAIVGPPAIGEKQNLNETTGRCLVCTGGFSLSITNSTCQPNAEPLTCTDGTVRDDGLCGKCLDSSMVPYANFSGDCPAGVCQSKCFAPKPFCTLYDPTNGNCLKCVPPLQALATGECVKLVPLCMTGQTNANGDCLSCQAGYFPSVTKKTCVKNDRNCDPNNILDNGFCGSCPANTVNVTLKCVPKVPDCNIYDGLGCLNCNPGFQRVSPNSCKPFIEGCLSQDATTGQCLSCSPGTIASTNMMRCFKIIDDCSSYNQDSGRCVTCGTNLAVGSGSKCVPLITGCDLYDETSGRCLRCTALTLGLDGKSCSAVITNCLYKNENDPLKCALCASGFYLSSNELTCGAVAPTVPTQDPLKVNLLGVGQITYSANKLLYCLTHSVSDLTVTFDPTSPTQPVVDFRVCDSVEFKLTLWSWFSHTGGVPDTIDKTKFVFDTVADLGLQPYFAPTNPTVTISAVIYTAAQLRLKVLPATLTPVAAAKMFLSATDFTTFNVRPTTSIIAGENLFFKGYTLQPKNGVTWTLVSGTPSNPGSVGVVSALGTTATDAGDKYVGAVPVANSNSAAFALAAAAGTGFFEFKEVRNNALPPYNDAEYFKLPLQVEQIVTIVDDTINIEWIPGLATPPLTDLSNVFPALTAKSGNRVSTACNFRYPEFSGIHFSPSYSLPPAFDSAGLPLASNLKKISVVRLPIFALGEKCGFSVVYTALTGVTTITGRIGYYTPANADGIFKDYVFTLGLQKASKDFFLDNMNAYKWNKLEADVARSVSINSEIYFFDDISLRKPLNDLKRGVLVNATSTIVQLNLVSFWKDETAPGSVKPFKKLEDTYKIVKATPYLLKSFSIGGTAAIHKIPLPVVGTLNATGINTCSFAVDLKNIESGQYTFFVEYFFLSSRDKAAPKRILAAEETITLPETLEVVKEISAHSIPVNFQYNSNGLENLRFNGLFMAVVLVCLAAFWGN